MILTPSEVASIATWSAFWEICEYISEAVVFLGCVGEFIAEYTNVRTEQWRHALGRRSLIILTLGIGAGLFSLIKTNALAGQVIGSLGEQAEQAGKKAQTATDISNTALLRSGQAATASVDAASKASKADVSASSALTLARGARREADSFEKDIVTAKKQAADAESHLAEALERAVKAEAEIVSVRLRVADRRITPAQQSAIRKALAAWIGKSLTIQLINLDGEIETFAVDLFDTLRVMPDWSIAMSAVTTPSGLSGTIIRLDPSASAIDSAFATNLVAALHAGGIDAKGPIETIPRTILGGGPWWHSGKFNEEGPRYEKDAGRDVKVHIEIGKKL